MNRIFEFFTRRHKLATLATVMILLLGLITVRSLKRDQFPKIDLAQMDIRTVYPGASPEDVELNVTNKIEDALKEVTGIDRIISSSFENRSEIEVYLDPDMKEMDEVKQNIRDAVAGVTDLPMEVIESPEVDEITTANIPVFEMGISGDLPYGSLREIARRLEKKVKMVDGVSNILKYGYRAREVIVEVSPNSLDYYQIPLRGIIQAIAARNIRQTGGTFESYTSEKNVVTLAQFKEPAEVGNVIVRSTFEGPQIRVKDLAIVREDFEEESLITRVNGIKAITFLVYKKEGADAVRTADAVKRMIREEAVRGNIDTEPGEKKSILTGKIEEHTTVRYGPVTISYANDISPQVRNRFQILLSNGAIGLVLVLIILAVFLNLKTAFWVAMGIPVSILGVCFFLPLFDSFLDSITLTAMILVMGIIVDDGIIISDNISRHREMGKAPLEAAVHGVQEVFLPVLTTVLTTILAFLPMFFMKGMMGQLVFVIPLTVCLALMISLYESTLALPAHLLQGMKKRAASSKGVHRKSMHSWFDTLRSFYRKLLLNLLKLRYMLVLLFVIVLAGSLWYAVKGMDFILFPSKGADRFFINMELPMGSSLAATSEKVKELEDLVRELPEGELENFITRVGIAGWPPIGQAENYAMIMVRLKPYSRRRRNADEIVESLRSRTDRLEGYVQIIFNVDSGGPPVGKAINLKVISTDDSTRNKLTDQVITLLGSIEGVKDINRDDIRGKDQLEIDIDYSKLARLGLTVAEVARNVRAAYDGELVTSMRDGAEDLRFRVQLAREARRDESFLLNLPIPNQQGRLIRLREAASLRTGPGPNAYRHYQGERAATITADVDTDVITPLKAVTEMLSHINLEKDWPGTEIIVGGEAGESRKSIVRLAATFIIALLGIYFLLVLLFDSFTQPLLVIAAIPFGLTGVIIALALHGEPLGFLAMTGVIGLVGVVVNDSLVLVSHINELAKQKTGMSLRELVAQGTANRLRAILLTTLTTAAGVLPLAYGMGGYDLYMAPMALTLGYGLLFATPLTLVLVPSLYLIGSDMGRIFKRKKAREGDF